jgi:hypothetical protein
MRLLIEKALDDLDGEPSRAAAIQRLRERGRAEAQDLVKKSGGKPKRSRK